MTPYRLSICVDATELQIIFEGPEGRLNDGGLGHLGGIQGPGGTYHGEDKGQREEQTKSSLLFHVVLLW